MCGCGGYKASGPPQSYPKPGHQPSKCLLYVTILYVLEFIRKRLAPLGIRTSFQPTNTLRQVLVCPKDPVPKENRSGVIYQIPCSRCLQTYIGQTGRTLGQRLKEHQRAVRDRNTSTSSLVDHICSTGHLVDWNF